MKPIDVLKPYFAAIGLQVTGDMYKKSVNCCFKAYFSHSSWYEVGYIMQIGVSTMEFNIKKKTSFHITDKLFNLVFCMFWF